MAPTFNGIGLAAADMATSLAFYRRLGLDFPAEADHEPHAEATLPGGIRLMWDTHASLRGFDPDFTPSSGGPEPGLPLRGRGRGRPSARRAGRGRQPLRQRARGTPPWGQRYAILRDPDGYQVELFAWVKQPG